MKRSDLTNRVRSLTRDFTNSIFREQDVVDFINEGIMRFKQVIPELFGLTPLIANQEEPKLIPEEYQHLLSVYSASRCFGQDERHYQATTLMNEFESKLADLKSKLENGEIDIIDPDTGLPVELPGNTGVDYVDLYPYWGIGRRTDNDEE